MPISDHEERMIKLQYQMRENNADLAEFLKDLESWESEIRQKEDKLGQAGDKKELPPVRNSLQKKKLKKKQKSKQDQPGSRPKKIPGYDYRAWDKFDIDKALEDADKEEEKSSSEYETDEEWENERKKHLAIEEKDKGNELLKKGEIELAIECYTRGIALDPTNTLLPANRAMALLKQGKNASAEVDCTTALALDPLYIKAYLRRASARSALGKLLEAQADYRSVLKLEPHNKGAQAELEKLDKEIARSKETPREMMTIETGGGVVKPIHKPMEMRSKKPLRRIPIEEIGMEEKDPIKETQAAQGDTAKRVPARNQEDFNRFLGSSEPSTAGSLSSKPSSSSSPSALTPASVTSFVSSAAAAAAAKPLISELDSKESRCEQNGGELSKSSPRQSRDSVRPSPTAPQARVDDAKDLVAAAASKAVPTTSFQFQTDYRELRDNIPAFFQYFKRIDPYRLPQLFGTCLQSSTLTTIFTVIQQCYIPEGEDYVPLLQWLPKVKRFGTTVMFLSAQETKVLTDIFSHLKNSGISQDEVDKLCKLYGRQ